MATKFGHHFHKFLDRTTCYDPADVLKQLEASLRALQTDYVDLYQFHSGNNEMFQTPGLWELLQKQVKAGKVRHLGISVSPNDNYFKSTAPRRSAPKRYRSSTTASTASPRTVCFNHASNKTSASLARVPLASGFLTGKYKPGAKFQANDVRSTHDQAKTEARLREVQQIRETEVPSGVDMAQWRWPGASSTTHCPASSPAAKPSINWIRTRPRRVWYRDDHPLSLTP